MIAISAGHHVGARGATVGDFSEYPETLKWAELIWNNIRRLYGKENSMLVPVGTLPKKVEFINRAVAMVGCQLAVEVHFNSAPGGGAKGSETLYHPGSTKGKVAAEIVQDGLAQIFKPDRGVKEGWYRMDRPGVVDYHGDVDGDEKPDYFLRATDCPAIIIEPEFIQNRITILHWREKACEIIAHKLIQARLELL